MTITVKYFASLREQIGRSQDEINAANIKTVADVWDAIAKGQPLKPNTLMAVNLEYVDVDYGVKEGDEVAFFPPVTGG